MDIVHINWFESDFFLFGFTYELDDEGEIIEESSMGIVQIKELSLSFFSNLSEDSEQVCFRDPQAEVSTLTYTTVFIKSLSGFVVASSASASISFLRWHPESVTEQGINACLVVEDPTDDKNVELPSESTSSVFFAVYLLYRELLLLDWEPSFPIGFAIGHASSKQVEVLGEGDFVGPCPLIFVLTNHKTLTVTALVDVGHIPLIEWVKDVTVPRTSQNFEPVIPHCFDDASSDDKQNESHNDELFINDQDDSNEDDFISEDENEIESIADEVENDALEDNPGWKRRPQWTHTVVEEDDYDIGNAHRDIVRDPKPSNPPDTHSLLWSIDAFDEDSESVLSHELSSKSFSRVLQKTSHEIKRLHDHMSSVISVDLQLRIAPLKKSLDLYTDQVRKAEEEFKRIIGETFRLQSQVQNQHSKLEVAKRIIRNPPIAVAQLEDMIGGNILRSKRKILEKVFTVNNAIRQLIFRIDTHIASRRSSNDTLVACENFYKNVDNVMGQIAQLDNAISLYENIANTVDTSTKIISRQNQKRTTARAFWANFASSRVKNDAKIKLAAKTIQSSPSMSADSLSFLKHRDTSLSSMQSTQNNFDKLFSAFTQKFCTSLPLNEPLSARKNTEQQHSSSVSLHMRAISANLGKFYWSTSKEVG
jgi:hypothetical protein